MQAVGAYTTMISQVIIYREVSQFCVSILNIKFKITKDGHINVSNKAYEISQFCMICFVPKQVQIHLVISYYNKMGGVKSGGHAKTRNNL